MGGGESEKECFLFLETGEMAYNSCLLKVRNASYLQVIAIKSILANRKLSISHHKGMNNGVDSLCHLDLL